MGTDAGRLQVGADGKSLYWEDERILQRHPLRLPDGGSSAEPVAILPDNVLFLLTPGRLMLPLVDRCLARPTDTLVLLAREIRPVGWTRAKVCRTVYSWDWAMGAWSLLCRDGLDAEKTIVSASATVNSDGNELRTVAHMDTGVSDHLVSTRDGWQTYIRRQPFMPVL
jgi:hypothetical protein